MLLIGHEPPLDPPDDFPECPECDAPLEIFRPDLAKCSECGWEHESDYTDIANPSYLSQEYEAKQRGGNHLSEEHFVGGKGK